MLPVRVTHPILWDEGGSVFLTVCFFGKPKELELIRERMLRVSARGRSAFRVDGYRLNIKWPGYVSEGGSLKFGLTSTLYLGSGSLEHEAACVQQALTIWVKPIKAGE